jgi:anti-sigma factor RsiW
MNCQEYRKQRLFDHEEGTLSHEARLHLVECGQCQALQKEEERLRAELQKLANSEHAPAALRQRISQMVESPNAGKRRDLRRWVTAAAAVVLLAGATGGLLWEHYIRTPSPERLAQAFVADYLEYLPGREQIAAGSPQQAEEWLQGRVDFPVHVPTVPGAALKTARICDISGRKAALLQYHHKDSNSSISVFVAAEPKAYERAKMEVNVETSSHGVHSVLWCHRGLVYDVVAALNDSSMQEITEAIRRQTP